MMSSPGSASDPETRPTTHQARARSRAVLGRAKRSWVVSFDCRLFPGKLKSHLPVTVGIITPILAHLDEQEQMHWNPSDLGDFLARFRADGFDSGAALAEHNLALAIAFHKNRLLDPDGFVVALSPAVRLDGGLVRQLLVQLPEYLFPRDLGRQLPHRSIRHLVLGIMEWPGGHHFAERLAQILYTIA